MKVLVTGATGFIGYYVIHELLKRNCQVIATDISTENARDKDWYRQSIFVEHFIGNETEVDLFEKFQRPHAMIHLAWQGLPNYKSILHFEENLPKQYFFLKKIIESGLKDLTVAGTCFEYGLKSGCLKEDMLPEPANPYALAKNTLRLFLEELRKVSSFQLKWVRLFYLYGKGQNPKSLLAQLETALENNELVFNMSGGQQVRDYLPVQEVAANIVSISLQNKTSGVINCCSGKPITVEALVKQYLALRNSSIQLNLGYYPYPDYEAMEFWGDNTKLKKILEQN
jgi:dTDP-6-deoxy-L-talose 4-dehydrogenase (NAD+)